MLEQLKKNDVKYEAVAFASREPEEKDKLKID